MNQYFDDFAVDDTFDAPSFTLSEGQILDYALTYDPQPIHIDAQSASESIYGGLIASGFQTISLCFRMMIQTRIFETVSMGGPGLDEVRFLQAVHPGDTIKTKIQIIDKIPSRSKSDRGIIKLQVSGTNQKGEIVVTYIVIMMGRRNPTLLK